MPVSDELLDLERRFWLEASVELYAERMAPDGVMVFGPVGVLDKEQTIAAVEAVSPWAHVEMTDVRAVDLTPDAAALVYRAHGVRDGQPPYDVLVTSVYVRRGGVWQLVLHQQTALD
jgi:hypothetical protein